MKLIERSIGMILEPLHCPTCDGTDVIKHGTSAAGKQRYRYQNPEIMEDPTVEAEVDEMWSFVQSKAQQRWL
jgi:hypothetical protein